MKDEQARRLAGLVDRAANARGVARSLPAESASLLERLVWTDDVGLDSSYVAAAADPSYSSAFPRMLAKASGSLTAELSMTEEERAAVRKMENVLAVERALGISSGPSGSFAVPLTLDPSVLASDGGSLNPLRTISRVELIAGNEWRGVSSEGLTASYDAEATEVSDDTPTLVQPVANVEKAQAFVPASIEVTMDWEGLAVELRRMFARAKNKLEAQKFLSGLGHASSEPEGIHIGSTIDVVTAANNAVVDDDIYNVKRALPPDFAPDASWIMNGTILDEIRKMTGPGSTQGAIFVDGDPPRVLGLPAYEYPAMDSAVTAGKLIAIVGDFRQAFLIVDRIGMSIEVVPHLLGANRRPSGQRGFYAWWRNGSKVLINNGLRTLRVAT